MEKCEHCGSFLLPEEITFEEAVIAAVMNQLLSENGDPKIAAAREAFRVALEKMKAGL